MREHVRAVLLVVIIVVSLCPACFAAVYSVTPITGLAQNESPRMINDNGVVVGLGFTWTAGAGRVALPATVSSPMDINNSNQITGQDWGVDRAARWSSTGSETVLNPIGSGSWSGTFTSSEGFAINSLGVVAGRSWGMADLPAGYIDQSKATIWDGATATSLGMLHGSDDVCQANDINDSGLVVGYSGMDSPDGLAGQYGWFYSEVPFYWTEAAGMQHLAAMQNCTSATKVNNNGWILGYSWHDGDPNLGPILDPDTPKQDILWMSIAASPVYVSTLTGLNGQWVTGVNDLNQIVGTTNNHAYMWTQTGGLVDLNAKLVPGSGWTLTGAVASSNNGLLLVKGTDGLGQAGYAVLQVVPEPASLLALASGLLCLGGLIRRKK